MAKSRSTYRFFPSTALLIGLATILCNGCANDGVRQQAAYDRQMERTEQALIAAGDTDSLAAAAMLSVGPKIDPAEGLMLIARAVTEDSNRPDLVWLNIRLCTQVEGCDPVPLEAQLRALDPDNGAAWVDSIGRAGKRDDVAAVRTGLVALATSNRFDTYWNPTIVHITNAILRIHALDLRTAFLPPMVWLRQC